MFSPFSLIKAGNKPAVTSTPGKPKKATTFQEFESITSDAWDVGDDDDELLAMAAQNLNIEVVMETANKVIENHSKLQEQRQLRLDMPPEPREREEEQVGEEEQGQEEDQISPECFRHSDSRLIKSHSEAPISSPKGLYLPLLTSRALFTGFQKYSTGVQRYYTVESLHGTIRTAVFAPWYEKSPKSSAIADLSFEGHGPGSSGSHTLF